MIIQSRDTEFLSKLQCQQQCYHFNNVQVYHFKPSLFVFLVIELLLYSNVSKLFEYCHTVSKGFLDLVKFRNYNCLLKFGHINDRMDLGLEKALIPFYGLENYFKGYPDRYDIHLLNVLLN